MLSNLINELRRRGSRLPRIKEVEVFYVSESVNKRFPSSTILKLNPAPYDLIITSYNEIHELDSFLNSVSQQTHLPNKVIVCDAGSTDGTYERLEKWKEESRFDIELIRDSGANISRGRNLAFKKASQKYALITDFGVSLDQDWALYLTSAFNQCPKLDFVMGYYQASLEYDWQRELSYYLLPRWDFIDPNTFFASARSMAISRSLYERVGGFPEFLTHAGEDSLFNFEIRQTDANIGFVPDAKCSWFMERDKIKMWKSIFRYSYGDAETGFLFWDYYLSLCKRVASLFMPLLLANLILILSSIDSCSNYQDIFYFICVVLYFIFLKRFYRTLVEYGAFINHNKINVFKKAIVLYAFLSAQFLGFIFGMRKGLGRNI